MMNNGLFLLLFLPVTALASPKSDASLGLGAGSTVGGTSGILVEKHLSDGFGLQGTLGFAAVGGRLGLGIGAYGVSPLIHGDTGGVAAVYGLDLRLAQTDDINGDTLTSPDVGIGGGVRGDVYLGPQMTVFLQTGVSVWALGKASTSNGLGVSAAESVSASGVGIRVGPRSALATLGFTWWFGA